MNDSPPPSRPWLPYVAPMAMFLVLTSVEDWLPRGTAGPHPTFYAVYYAFKIAVVALTCWLGRSTWRDLSPRPGVGSLGLSVIIGLLVTALWVGLDGLYPTLSQIIGLLVTALRVGLDGLYPTLSEIIDPLVTALRVGLDGLFGEVGSRVGFDPNVLTPVLKVAFLAVRLFGLVLIVPLFEELFWRSFVVRWIIDPDDFRKVPIGRVTPIAAAVTAGLFAIEHPAEWLPALLTGFLWAWLLHQTKSVSACFVSHAVANLGLGVYVLTTGNWKFW